MLGSECKNGKIQLHEFSDYHSHCPHLGMEICRRNKKFDLGYFKLGEPKQRYAFRKIDISCLMMSYDFLYKAFLGTLVGSGLVEADRVSLA